MNFVEIKQEYEIGDVEEDNFDEQTYGEPEKVEDSCCLCQKGNALRKKLLVHLENRKQFSYIKK